MGKIMTNELMLAEALRMEQQLALISVLEDKKRLDRYGI